MSQRFTVNDDSTVIDQSTDLMWQRETAGPMDWKDAISYCKNLRLGGYDDWRLPTIEELFLLADRSRCNPAIDIIAFPNTMSSPYWSSATNVNWTGDALCVQFNISCVGSLDKSFNYYVRAVRGGKT